MKCIRCGNETYKSTTTEAIELNGGVLVIRNIPCYKCETELSPRTLKINFDVLEKSPML